MNRQHMRRYALKHDASASESPAGYVADVHVESMMKLYIFWRSHDPVCEQYTYPNRKTNRKNCIHTGLFDGAYSISRLNPNPSQSSALVSSIAVSSLSSLFLSLSSEIPQRLTFPPKSGFKVESFEKDRG